MDHSIWLVVLISIIAVTGLYKLAQIFGAWLELDSAVRHEAIDARGLVPWAETFEAKMTRTNLVLGAVLALSVLGVLTSSTALGDFLCVSAAAGLMLAGSVLYGRFRSEFDLTVGLSAERASEEVMAVIR